MEEKKPGAAPEETPSEAAPAYEKPKLKKLGDVSEVTKSSTSFSNTQDSSNILGSDYS